MRGVIVCLVLLLFMVDVPLIAQTSYPQPYPAGMRVQVTGQGALARNTPSLSGLCGADSHPCGATDVVLPGVFGVVQNDPPVLDTAGFWWLRVTFDTQVTGWVTAYPPFLITLNPPQMVAGASFRIGADYSGPPLTEARCLYDGLQVTGSLALQPSGATVSGTIQCALWDKPPVGNHIAVVQAVNLGETGATQTTPSAEFQVIVTDSPKPTPPTAPANLRIMPVNPPTANK
jgi:hypothetical protein